MGLCEFIVSDQTFVSSQADQHLLVRLWTVGWVTNRWQRELLRINNGLLGSGEAMIVDISVIPAGLLCLFCWFTGREVYMSSPFYHSKHRSTIKYHCVKHNERKRRTQVCICERGRKCKFFLSFFQPVIWCFHVDRKMINDRVHEMRGKRTTALYCRKTFYRFFTVGVLFVYITHGLCFDLDYRKPP